MLDISDSDADGASTISLKPPAGSGSEGAGSPRASRGKSATPRELADMLTRTLGGASVLLAMWVDVEEAALTPDEARNIADPTARIIARSQWGKRAAKYLLAGDDYVALSLALFAYGVRVAPLVAEKVGSRPRVIRPTSEPVRTAPASAAGNTANANNAAESVGNSNASNGHVKFSGVAGFGAEAN